MSFESFPRDGVQAYEDTGIYYVNEKGKLRSPPGMGPKSIANDWDILGQSPPQLINGIFLSKKHQIVVTETCDDGKTRNIYNPKKLLDISMMFVADNINLVESFAGFPEIVGEQLFHGAMELGKFENHHTAEISVKLFYEAYGDVFLESLSLRDRHEILTEHLDCVYVFSGLRALDFGGCGLGNDHEILSVIGNMYSLQDLCLCDNRLSDVSIQKMTTPLRLLGRGPKHLQALDLSGNSSITNAGAKYLTSFNNLLRLDLSGCGVLISWISQLYTLRPINTDGERSQFPITIANKGWAVSLIQRWLCGSRKPRVDTERILKAKSRAQTFYGKTQIIPPPLFSDSNKQQNQPVIQLIADKVSYSEKLVTQSEPVTQPAKRLKTLHLPPSSSNNNSFQSTTNDKRTGCKKVTRQKQTCDPKIETKTGNETVIRTKLDEVEDTDDLMKSYLDARKRDNSDCSQGSLWNAMSSQGW